MNTRSRIVLIVFLTVVLMTAVAIPAQAKKASNFLVEFSLWDDGTPENPGDPYTAVGEYTMTYNEAELGVGDVYFFWIPRYGVKQGTMVFTDVDGSVMVVRTTMFYDFPSDDCAGIPWLGHYQILNEEHEGEKYALVGSGDLTACGVAGVLEGSLVGWATPH